jgi:hypothetical protein
VIFRFLFPDKLYSVFPSLRSRLDWENPDSIFLQVKKFVSFLQTKAINPKKGWELHYEAIPDKEFTNQKDWVDIFHFVPDPNNANYVQKIVDLCREKQIKLVFVTTPTLQNYTIYPNYEDPFNIAAFVEKNGLTWYKFDLTKLNRMHFYDTQHVNALGGEVLSADMAVNIAKELGITVDETKLAGYESFAGLKHSLQKEGNNYVFSIQTNDPSSPLQFQWTLKKGDNVVQIKEWTTENTFSFTIDSLKDVTLDVKIKKPGYWS